MAKSNLVKLGAAVVVALLATSSPASATTITAIFGGGNPASGWTSDTANDITLGLRAKNRTTGDTTNAGGVYTFATAPGTRGLWNYEFTINSGSSALSAYDYYLGVDSDSSQGINFNYVNPIFHWGDNSFGDSSTAQGAGLEPTTYSEYLSYPTLYSLVQGSQNITFGDQPGGGQTLSPNATYHYTLFAVASGAGVGAPTLASTSIQVVVGDGGAAVPDGGSILGLLGCSFLGLAGIRRFFGKRA